MPIIRFALATSVFHEALTVSASTLEHKVLAKKVMEKWRKLDT
jgi:hypothetical protein